MDNFDAHKWFKKEYLGEGHTEDKSERDQFIRRYDQLSDDDKLKLAKIQAMMAKERSLKEDDLNEEARLTEMDYYDEIKFHLNQYNAGNIDGDDLANAIEEIVLDAKVDAI